MARRAVRSWLAWDSWVSGGALVSGSTNGSLGAGKSLGSGVPLLAGRAQFSGRTHVSFGPRSTISTSDAPTSQGARGASGPHQSPETRLSSLPNGPWRSFCSLPAILPRGPGQPHRPKVSPLACLPREPREAIEASIPLGSCVTWEATRPICSRTAHFTFPAWWPHRSLKASGTLWAPLSRLSFQARIPRQARGARAPSESHGARGALHGELSLLQNGLSLCLLEGHGGPSGGAACKLERHHDYGAREPAAAVRARHSWEAGGARQASVPRDSRGPGRAWRASHPPGSWGSWGALKLLSLLNHRWLSFGALLPGVWKDLEVRPQCPFCCPEVGAHGGVTPFLALFV